MHALRDYQAKSIGRMWLKANGGQRQHHEKWLVARLEASYGM